MEVAVNWLDGPAEGEGKRVWKITRTPTNGSVLKCAILSDELVMCRTHWRGRTVPCTLPNCECVFNGEKSEFHAYFFAVQANTQKRILVEVTAGPCNVLKQTRAERGTLRGTEIELSRVNGKANGQVHVKINKKMEAEVFAAAIPDIREILYTMWRFDPEARAAVGVKQAMQDAATNTTRMMAVNGAVADTQKVLGRKKERRKRS